MLLSMVKNKKGGSKHKKMARKNVSSNNYENIKLVESTNKYELYACVTRLLGNGMAEVLCNDEKKRLLIIRGKFCGRNRRDNQITLGSLVLVGIREWEVVKKNKLPKSDLLYVYSKTQTSELKALKDFKNKILPEELKETNIDFNIHNKLNTIKEEEEKENNENNPLKVEIKQRHIDFNLDDI